MSAGELILCVLWIDHHVLLLVRIVARHDGDGWLGVAEIEGLVGYVRRDEQEVSRDIHDAFLKPFARAGLDTPLYQIDCRLIALVHVRLSRTARRNDDLQKAEVLGSGGRARDAAKARPDSLARQP